MSDFLSSFNKNNYKDTKEKKQAGQDKREELSEKQESDQQTSYDRLVEKVEGQTTASQSEFGPKNVVPETVEIEKTEEPKPEFEESMQRPSRRQHSEEHTETDPTYSKRKKRKRMLIGLGALLGVGLLFIFYYQSTHIKLPDFKGKELAEVRTWATENKVTLKIDQEYDLKNEANRIISQKIAPGKKIKKGSKFTVNASLGPDPEEKLTLPDFMTMSKKEAEKWLKENQATNLSLVDQYSETEEKGKALRFEIVNKDVSKENYKRKDKANVYYSKGKETFEKNISVPDFSKKTRADVESWAKNNEIEMTYEEDSSADISLDGIISQSIPKDQKIAKKESMSVKVSLGKGFVIPNFADYTFETAVNAVEGVSVQAKSVFSETVPYGQIISQSIEAGTELTSKDELKVVVYYSAGRPFLKDLRGNTVEGDLQKYFFEEFQSKGASIDYTIRYVDSDQPKGTVVGMSTFSQYIPLEYTATIDISLGNLGNANDFSAKNASNSDSGSQQIE
ncbi:PASTA domain-containing protein [Enterococcus sp. LJL99]